jgi:hypothetical protein
MRSFFSINDAERLQFSRYGSSDLASPDRFWRFSHGCHEDRYPRKICPNCFIHDNGDLYSRPPCDVDHVIRLLFPDILVLVLLPILIDYINGCTHVRSLNDLRLFFRWWDFFLASIMLKDCNSLGIGLQILLRQIDFGDFLMVATRTVILVKFVPAASFTTMVNYIPDPLRCWSC